MISGLVLVFLLGATVGSLLGLLCNTDSDACVAPVRSGPAGEVGPDHPHPK